MACPRFLDDTFGPQYCNKFDFTLTFEQSLLQIAPCAVLLLLAPWRASQLHRQTVKTIRSNARSIKFAAILLLVLTQVALLITWSVTPLYKTRTAIPAAALSLAASLALLYISALEHTRSIRPSLLINVYILFSTILDLPQARSLLLRPDAKPVAVVFLLSLVAKLCILYLEARSKVRFLLPAITVRAPESLVSIYNLTTIWWINPLFVKGFNSLLTIDTLYVLDNDLLSKQAEAKFKRYWSKHSTSGSQPLLRTYFQATLPYMLSMVIPRLCLAALTLSQPLLIARITVLLSEPSTPNNLSAGYGLIGATALIYLGIAITTALYRRQLDRLMTTSRSMLIASVYAKSLKLSEQQLIDSAALSLISNDAARIAESLDKADVVFAVPLEFAVATYLLSRQIGVLCLAPILFVMIITAISYLGANVAIPMQKKWLTSLEERVAYTASVLGYPKASKMLGWTDFLTDKIQALRIKELKDYAGFRKFIVYKNAFAAIPDGFSGAVTLTVLTLVRGPAVLSPSVAFTTLALVALLSEPFTAIIQFIPMFLGAFASLERTQKYLLLPEHSLPSGYLTDEVVVESSRSQEIPVKLTPLVHARDISAVVCLEQATVKLGKEERVILRDLNFVAREGELSFVIGPVGSGKSVLLKTLIGEVGLASGKRSTKKRSQDFAYCAQDPWLPNATVKELVTAGLATDNAWLETILQACALQSDINAFENGIDTIVGTKGVSLSGGQRQRVALARALYTRKNVLIIDDVFAGLDHKTSRHIFDAVFGKHGLCRKYGKTVVIVSHVTTYLSQADWILALTSDGSITSQGPYSSMAVEAETVLADQNHDRKQIPENVEEKPIAIKAAKPADTMEDKQRDLARRTGDLTVYSYYIKSIGWRLCVFMLCGTVTGVVGLKFPNLWVRWWSESNVSPDYHPRHPLGVWIGVYFVLGCMGVAGIFTTIWGMLVYAVPKSSAELHKRILSAVKNAPYSIFVKTDSGVILNRFASDMRVIDQSLAGATMMTVDGTAYAVVSAAFIVAGADYAALSLPFLLLILYGVQKYYLRTSRQLRFLELEAMAPMLAHCSEAVSGITTIRAFAWQHKSFDKCMQLLDNSARPYYLLLCIQRWLTLVLNLINAMLALIVVALALSMRSSTSSGSIGASLFNVLSFNGALTWLITSWTTLETAIGAVARCKNFEAGMPSEHTSREILEPGKDWPSSGSVTFDSVAASYSEEGEDVIKGISFAIQAGEKIGICGRSGSGKSSLLLTLLRLLDTKAGSIKIDGLDLADLPRGVIRSRLTAIPQETILVPGSVRVNLDPMNSMNDEELQSILSRVGLLDLIAERGGLDGAMTDLVFSHGQMQMFAVCRALVRRSSILIVDEMTSSVDAETEKKLMEIILDEFKSSTVLAVAHRLQTIADFDRVMVMSEGRIVEIGNPRVLLEKEGSHFRELWMSNQH